MTVEALIRPELLLEAARCLGYSTAPQGCRKRLHM
jgi:hypothetical protein